MILVRHPRDASQIPLQQFARPIAVEFVDVRSPRDGLIRKYRYMAVGDAAETYTLLTIGDGLVAQIPALIISTFLRQPTSSGSTVQLHPRHPHGRYYQR